MAAKISSGCWPWFCCAAAAVPCMLPRTLIGTWIEAAACSMASLASDSERPSARLYDTVVASSPSWWLTLARAASSLNEAISDNGIIVCAVVLTVAPVDASREPGLALTVGVEAAVVAAAAVPAAATALLPLPATRTSRSDTGLCANCGIASITTWYWFSAS